MALTISPACGIVSMAKPEHRTMKAAQAACRRLRAKCDLRSMRRANKIEAEWKEHHNYMSDAEMFLRAQAGYPPVQQS